MEFSTKYKKFLKHKADIEFLEGTTAAGKTTVGVIKFILKCVNSEKKDHVLSGLDLGVIEKNIINADLGLKEIFGSHISYYSNGYQHVKLPHLRIGGKIIYVLGYADKARWKKVLGAQAGCVYIDEINIADIDFVREITGRCDYLMGTLNPDSPDLDVYKEYINKSRPLKEFEKDYPKELLVMLDEPEEEGWTHWYFSFEDNVGLTKEMITKKIRSYPKGTKIYKNKVLGLRGRATGLVFDLRAEHIITEEQAKKMQFTKYSVGIDTSYSSKTEDTMAFIYGGLNTLGQWIVLNVQTYNNKDLITKIAPSDNAKKIDQFIMDNNTKWGFTRSVFIDSADQGTILECRKLRRTLGRSYIIEGSYKKTTIYDRINLQRGWMDNEKFFIVKGCRSYIDELNTYSWTEKDVPEDIHDHTINACQYGWLPYKGLIGKE